MTGRLFSPDWGREVVIAIVTLAAMNTSVCAQDASKFKYMGVEVERHVQDYIVTTDVNIRSHPRTKSKKIGSLKKHQRIKAVGKAPGAWVAVQKDGKDIGFVYEPVLIGVLDGTLDEPIKGAVSKAGHPECQYMITFEGKSEAQGQLFEIADYEVQWRCQHEDKVSEFVTPMFMTEGPYKKSKNPVYQITVDIVDRDGDLDEVVSTTVFYDYDDGTISFDGMSVKRFAGKPDVLEVFARSLPAALRAGVEMSYQAWTRSLWNFLLKT